MNDAIMGQWIAAGSGLLGVLIGSAITVGNDQLARRAERRRRASYLAVRVVCALDLFVEKCVEVALDDGRRDKGGYLVPETTPPSAPDFPADVDWQSIDHELAYEILSLTNDVADARGAISFAAEISGPPDEIEYFEARITQYAALGLKAAKIATHLRKKFGIPMPPTRDWDPVARLEEAARDVTQQAADRSARSARLMTEGASGS